MTPPLVKSFPFGYFILALYQKNVTSALYCYTVISTNNMVLVSKYEFKIWKKYTQNCHKINITDCFRCTYHIQVNLRKLMLFIHFFKYFCFCFIYPLQSKNSIFYKAAVIIFNDVVAAVFCCCGCGCCGLCCCCYCCCCYGCHCCYCLYCCSCSFYWFSIDISL